VFFCGKGGIGYQDYCPCVRSKNKIKIKKATEVVRGYCTSNNEKLNGQNRKKTDYQPALESSEGLRWGCDASAVQCNAAWRKEGCWGTEGVWEGGDIPQGGDELSTTVWLGGGGDRRIYHSS
jgi:hypothetical protein